MPAASPLTVCVPLLAWLVVNDGPVTVTDVALLLDHVIDAEPGAEVLIGDAEIVADTDGGCDVTLAWAEPLPLKLPVAEAETV